MYTIWLTLVTLVKIRAIIFTVAFPNLPINLPIVVIFGIK